MDLNYDALRRFFRAWWENSEAKGFHEKFDAMRETINYLRTTDAPRDLIQSMEHALERQRINEYIVKLGLIGTEVSEAIEALRNPNWDPLKTYYKVDGAYVEATDLTDTQREHYKPEGFGSELADIVIRTGDLAVVAGVDLATEIYWKMRNNLRRAYRHGDKRA